MFLFIKKGHYTTVASMRFFNISSALLMKKCLVFFLDGTVYVTFCRNYSNTYLFYHVSSTIFFPVKFKVEVMVKVKVKVKVKLVWVQ